MKGLQANVPLFEPRENNVSFYAGDTATLLCSVTGLQTRLVSMFSDKHEQFLTYCLQYAPEIIIQILV